jgi:hypothetical protein
MIPNLTKIEFHNIILVPVPTMGVNKVLITRNLDDLNP